MPKFTKAQISNTAAVLVFHAMDDGFCNVKEDIDAIERVEFAAYLKRCLAEGKRRIIIDVKYT